MKLRKFQMGGQAPQEQAPQGQPDPQAQIAEMAAAIIEQVGPEGAAMLAQTIMQMLEGAAQQAPTYARKGTKLVRRG